MRLKSAVFAALSIGSIVPASAQGFEVQGLSTLDSWSLGWLSADEGAFPNTLWRSSTADGLRVVFESIDPDSLSSHGRELLRRALMSAGSRPSGNGSDALLVDRAEFLMALGQNGAAAELLLQIDAKIDGVDALALDTDLALAGGSEASACANVNGGTPSENAYWRKLRAVCFALAGNSSSAELALEFAISSGVDDTWFSRALLYTATGGAGTKPAARFRSGIDVALVKTGELELDRDSFDNTPAELAAIIANRTDLPERMRVEAADIAAKGGALSPRDHRAAYDAFLRTGETPIGSAVETAIKRSGDTTIGPVERARTYQSALKSAAGNPAEFKAVARLLSPELATLSRNAGLEDFGLDFAVANLAAGDYRQAAIWRQRVDATQLPETEDLKATKIDAMLVMVGQERSNAAIEAIVEEITKHSSKHPNDMSELVAMWTAMDAPVSRGAQRFLMASKGKPSGDRFSPPRLSLATSAFRNGASGEGAMIAASMLPNDMDDADTNDLVSIVHALKRAGQVEFASELAMEAIKYRTLISK